MNENNTLFEELKALIYKDVDEAEKRIRKIKPNESELPLVLLIRLYIWLGAQLEITDLPERAIVVLKEGLNLSVDDDDKAECLRYIGDSLWKLEKYNEAISTFNEVLSLAKDQYLIASAYSGLQWTYYRMDDFKKALFHAKEAIKHYDINEESHLYEYYFNFTRIIICCLLLGKKEEADKYINNLFTRKGVYNWALSDVYYELGHYYYKKGEWGYALENYKNALAYYDGDDMEFRGKHYWYIATCYHNLGELDKAKENYAKALELKKDPNDIKDIRAALNMIINKR